jgi:hypothetical protein
MSDERDKLAAAVEAALLEFCDVHGSLQAFQAKVVADSVVKRLLSQFEFCEQLRISNPAFDWGGGY